MTASASISAIVPARNEEAVIQSCIESLAAQPEIAEIIAVNDQSTDRTLEILQELARAIPRMNLVEVPDLPSGWVGKNHAVFIGAQEAREEWLLFTDADAVLEAGAARKALEIAKEQEASLVSFSPEQVLEKWYEKALIPFVYVRLAQKFSFDQVNDSKSSAAAANGQFLMVRRDVYQAAGGHRAVHNQVLEDVALAKRVKSAGARIWFGYSDGAVRVRMYRSFRALWEGWRKNLFALVGGTTGAAFSEFESSFPWMIVLVLLVGIKLPIAMFAGVVLLLSRQLSYGMALTRNQFPFKYIMYYLPAVVLYAAVLWASHESYAKGRVSWKGREYPVGPAGASNK